MHLQKGCQILIEVQLVPVVMQVAFEEFRLKLEGMVPLGLLVLNLQEVDNYQAGRFQIKGNSVTLLMEFQLLDFHQNLVEQSDQITKHQELQELGLVLENL